jgi:predicted amidophosphoribosyltransferase
LFATPIIVVGAWLAGKRVRRKDECSYCEHVLSDEPSEHCPKCGGDVRGVIEPHEHHVDAAEKRGAVTAFGLAAPKDQDDADPRYVARGVKCPHCGWIPNGGLHWSCDECEGGLFDTFKHGGECPECKKVFEDTFCPQCQTSSPYDFWWPERSDE